MDHFRECFDRQVAATDELLRNFLNGPAPKEEEMKPIERIAAAAEAYMAKATEVEPLHTNLIMAQLNHMDSLRDPIPRAAYRRALAREAYMAALGGLCAGGNLNVTDTAGGAAVIALETVRRWDAFMAAVDAEGGE